MRSREEVGSVSDGSILVWCCGKQASGASRAGFSAAKGRLGRFHGSACTSYRLDGRRGQTNLKDHERPFDRWNRRRAHGLGAEVMNAETLLIRVATTACAFRKMKGNVRVRQFMGTRTVPSLPQKVALPSKRSPHVGQIFWDAPVDARSAPRAPTSRPASGTSSSPCSGHVLA